MEALGLYNGNQCQFKCYPIDSNSVLINTTPSNEIYVTGILNIRILHGRINVMGYELSLERPCVTVNSVKEYCLLKIVPQDTDTHALVDESCLSSLNLPDDISHQILSNFFPIFQLILISKHEDMGKMVQFVYNYQLPLFVGESSEKPLSEWFLLGQSKYQHYLEGPEWNATIDTILTKKSPISE